MGDIQQSEEQKTGMFQYYSLQKLKHRGNLLVLFYSLNVPVQWSARI